MKLTKILMAGFFCASSLHYFPSDCFSLSFYQDAPKPASQTDLSPWTVSGFQVWIAANNIQGIGPGQDRWVHILVKPENFSKQDLQSIFVSLAAKYEHPLGLRASAYADRETLVRAMRSQALLGLANPPNDPEERKRFIEKYSWPSRGVLRAYYRRSNEGEEVFWYTPNPEEQSVAVTIRNNDTEVYTGDPTFDLGLAARRGEIAKARELLANGADANAKDDRGYAALSYAARLDKSDLLQMLLDADADVKTTTPNGSTPLIEAAYYGRLEAVRLLLKAGAAVNTQNGDGVSALTAATLRGRADVVKALLAVGADPNATMVDGKTILLLAAENRRTEIIEALLSKGADVNAKTQDGRTALIVCNCDTGTLRTLLRAGAGVNAKDGRGWTALMYAADRGKGERVAVLLGEGADVRLKNSQGETALDIARKYRGNNEVVRLLKKAGAKE